MEKQYSEGSKGTSSTSIPGGGATSPFNEDCLGSGKGGRKGAGDGAGKQWDPGVVDAFFRARDEIRQISRRQREGFHGEIQIWT